jgi:hypothetical protein
MKTGHLLSLLIVFCVTCLGASCNDSQQSYSTASGSSYSGSNGFATAYNGPGSAWSLTLNLGGTFEIEVRDTPGSSVDTYISGTYERISNGFLELTVSFANGSNPPLPGEMAAAIEAPDFGFWMRPFGNADGELIPMIIGGNCPTADVAGNWMMMTCDDSGVSCDATSNAREFFGSFNYDAGTSLATLPARFTLGSGSDLGMGNLGTASCSDGLMVIDADTMIYLTATDGAIVQVDPSSNSTKHIVAIPEEVIVQVDLEGSYIGLAFDRFDDASHAVRIVVDSGGATGTIYYIDPDNLETDLAGTAVGTLAFSDVNEVNGTAADGWITGTFNWSGSSNRPLYCMSASDLASSGQGMILCVGQGPVDDEKFFNFVLIRTG